MERPPKQLNSQKGMILHAYHECKRRGGSVPCRMLCDHRRPALQFHAGHQFGGELQKNQGQGAILGKPGQGNKSTGWEGSGKATFHYNSSVFRKLFYNFKETGEDIYFDIQVTNEDPASSVGRQTVILKDCNLNGGVLAKFSASDDYLQESIDFTFEDFEMPETFKNLAGM